MLRLDYIIQSGPAKGLAFTLRRGSFRTGVPDSQSEYDFGQTRFLVCCSRNNFSNYSPTLQVSFLPRRVPGECSGYYAGFIQRETQ